jgi:Ca2+-binding EF-hand superfamily protein
MKKIITAILLLSIGSPLCLAKEKKKRPGPPSAEEAFKGLDKSGDSILSLEEFLEGKSDREKAKADFAKADADKDGSLTLEEFSTVERPGTRERKKRKPKE